LKTGAAAGYTLLEVALVVSLLVAISAIAIPSFVGQLVREELPGSAAQLRSLISLTRANAAYDGKRYRIRFPGDDEKGLTGDERQPIVEREDDPLRDPETYSLVTAPWAVGNTFLGKVWCPEIRMGRPTIEDLQLRRERGREDISEDLFEEVENLEPQRPPLYIEPDGASEWAAFVLTLAPPETPIDEIEDHPQLELIVEGNTGLAWIQRPFYDEELDLFEEKGWPAVLRQDFLDPRVLTEDDVLELHEITVRP
jgi:type II secretory pathway pseudopilin PulG